MKHMKKIDFEDAALELVVFTQDVIVTSTISVNENDKTDAELGITAVSF